MHIVSLGNYLLTIGKVNHIISTRSLLIMDIRQLIVLSIPLFTVRMPLHICGF